MGIAGMTGMSGTLSFSLLLLLTMLGMEPADTRHHGSNSNKERLLQYTEGEGGVLCHRTLCLAGDGMHCFNGKCHCGSNYHQGDAVLMCQKEDEHVCKLISDPVGVGFNGQSFTIPASCKFLMTSVKTMARAGSVDVGECSLEVMAWGAKGRGPGTWGKHFIAGLDAQFTVMLDDGSFHYHSTRLYGWATNGRYRFIEQGTTSIGASSGYSANITTNIPAVGTIETVWDHDNNIAEIQAAFCGVVIGFRPPEINVDKINARFVPGVYIKIKHSHDPVFLSPDSSLCLAPKGENKTLENYIDTLYNLYGKRVNKNVAMMFRILNMGIDQHFPSAPRMIQIMLRAAKDCDDRTLLCGLQECMFITRKTKFLRCWTRPGRTIQADERYDGDEEDDEHDENHDQDGQRIMNLPLLLMHRCMESFCVHSQMRCRNVKRLIRRARCWRYAPRRSIMNYNCSNLP